jgi:hypothetical protein
LTRDTWQGNEYRPRSYNKWGYVEGNPIILTDHRGHDIDCSPLWDYACWNEKNGFELEAARYSNPWTGPAQDQKTSAYGQRAFLKYLEVSAIKCYVSTMDVLAATSHAEYGNLDGGLKLLSLEALGRQFYHACGSKGECKNLQLWVFLGAQQGWYSKSAATLISYMQNPKARLDAEIIRDTHIWRDGKVWNQPWVTGNLSLYKQNTQDLILNANQGVAFTNYLRLDKTQPDPFLIFTPGQASYWQGVDG